jgi:hypothetical protein
MKNIIGRDQPKLTLKEHIIGIVGLFFIFFLMTLALSFIDLLFNNFGISL